MSQQCRKSDVREKNLVPHYVMANQLLKTSEAKTSRFLKQSEKIKF